jgi:ribulose-phosphate 3-epimerase
MKSQTTFNKLKQSSPLISVGILTADMMQLGSEIELLEETGVELLHIDVMDGRIWSKITFGPPFLAGLKTKMLKDVHLLIDKPEKHIESFAKAGADIIVFSVEYCDDVSQTLSMIGQMENANAPDRGILRGVSLNPETPIDIVAPVIDDVDIVLLLAVGPDTVGQNFISELPGKITELKKVKEDVLIFVDGSIKKDNIAEVAAMGPDVIITGSAVFDGKDPAGNAKFMMETINERKTIKG